MPNILVVDDAGIIRYKIKNELSAEGINVFEAPKAKLVRNDTFSKNISLRDIDLILLDIYLKDKNGLELLEYVKNTYPYISVIMISTESKKSIIRKAIDLGADDYLAKPFDKEILLTKLNKLISKENKKNKTKTSRNKQNELKTRLSYELNRAVRSGLSMSLVKFIFSDKNNKEEYGVIKDTITGIIRNIDQVYFVDDRIYIFLLPLTDKVGSEVFIKKILNKIKESIEIKENDIEIKKTTFPEDIIDENEKKPDPYKLLQYKEEIITSLALNIKNR